MEKFSHFSELSRKVYRSSAKTSPNWQSTLLAIQFGHQSLSCPYCEIEHVSFKRASPCTRSGKRMKTAKDILHLTPLNEFSDCEWRFFKCPENQQHWCEIYEHCRNNSEVVAAVEGYRAHGYWSRPGMFANPCHQRLGCDFFDAFPEFPKAPFLALDVDLRRTRCAKLDKEREYLRARQLPGMTSVFVSERTRVWVTSDDVTKEEFLRLYQASKPSTGRRRVAADRLRDLSILQLYRYCESWESVVSYLDDLGVNSFSENCSQLCRCGSRAVEDIQTVLSRIV